MPAAEQATRLALQAAAGKCRGAHHARPGPARDRPLRRGDRRARAARSSQSPKSPEALNFYGVALKSVGRLDEAREHILKALKLNERDVRRLRQPQRSGRFLRRAMARSCSTGWTRSSNRPRIPNADPFLPLHFAYAKALDDRGEHERALEHYITGGKMKRAQLDYKEEDTFGFFDSIRAAFPKEVFENRKYRGHSTTNGRCSSSACRARARPWSSRSSRAIPTSMAPARSNISAARSASFATASRRCRNSRR